MELLIGLLITAFVLAVVCLLIPQPVEVQTEAIGKRDELLVTITYLWWPRRGKVRKYRGSCTVWYTYPACNRCNLSEEMFLTRVWRKHQWMEEDKKRQ